MFPVTAPLVQSWPFVQSAGSATTQNLTGSAATVGAQFAVSHAGQMAIDVMYTPGEDGNTLTFYLEYSPDPMSTAEGSSKWFQMGGYNDAAGTFTEEKAQYQKVGASHSSTYNCVPVEVATTHQKARLRALDNAASTHGKIQAYLNYVPTSA